MLSKLTKKIGLQYYLIEKSFNRKDKTMCMWGTDKWQNSMNITGKMPKWETGNFLSHIFYFPICFSTRLKRKTTIFISNKTVFIRKKK